ncbi:hypothetical protein CLV70_11877 [Pseudosporangium ferrugineum]|uniref:YbaB/EbfC DNA-binding family protein n=1 Tax=Pseudosporangium ferrugineum TaxID=439699 RepID=A0A2T0RLL2_9ACTN|nr:hypothetical protein CLV70_11877 [Pseudosporangium ferrugineum]
MVIVAYPGAAYESAVRADGALGELRRISVELRALSAVAKAASRPGGRYEASDPTRTVTVTVDGRRQVRDVSVDPRWAERISGGELGEALAAAYGAAVLRALTSGSAAIDEAWAGTDRAVLEREVDAELEALRPRPVEPGDLRYELERQLEQNEMLLRYGDSPAAVPAPAPDATVSGPGGFVTVVVSDGQVADVRVLASRIPAMATNGTIAQEAMAAFRAAARAGAA